MSTSIEGQPHIRHGQSREAMIEVMHVMNEPTEIISFRPRIMDIKYSIRKQIQEWMKKIIYICIGKIQGFPNK